MLDQSIESSEEWPDKPYEEWPDSVPVPHTFLFQRVRWLTASSLWQIGTVVGLCYVSGNTAGSLDASEGWQAFIELNPTCSVQEAEIQQGRLRVLPLSELLPLHQS